MFCVKCGAEVSDNDMFCSKCGTAVNKTDTKDTVNDTVGNTVNNSAKSNVKRKSKVKKALTKEIIPKKFDDAYENALMKFGPFILLVLIIWFIIFIVTEGYSFYEIKTSLLWYAGIASIVCFFNEYTNSIIRTLILVLGTFGTCFFAIGLLHIYNIL